MIDPDPARPVLRLGDTPARKPASVDDACKRLTLAEHEMEQAIKRWSAAYTDWTAMRAQAQPISASPPVGDGAVRYERAPAVATGSDTLIFRADGTVVRV